MNTIQYTIRSIPPAVDLAIRKRARIEGTSFNQTVVNLLTMQALGTKGEQDTSFDWLFGKAKPDPSFEAAIAEMSQIDEEMWAL